MGNGSANTRRYAGIALIIVSVGVLAYLPIRALHTARAALATTTPGPIEIGFAQTMGLHHQQAIDMSQLMQDGRPTALLILARTIEGTQQLELGEMRGWLRLWQQPLLPAAPGMGWMLTADTPPSADLKQYLLDCRRASTGMVGLAAMADLERLRQLQGRERDRLFLTLMLAHHQGAIPMAAFAATQAHIAPVRELAQRIVFEQAEESTRIRMMLQALDAMEH
jgi:uncharacterized protein (DUF305 family)